MFSHVVIFWTDPAVKDAANKLVAGANAYLKPIPGVTFLHVGKMATSHLSVVDQSYQVALNMVFQSKQVQEEYQRHPLHQEFVKKIFKPFCRKVVIYDFE